MFELEIVLSVRVKERKEREKNNTPEDMAFPELRI